MMTNKEAIDALQTAAEQWAHTLNWPVNLTVEIGEAKAQFNYEENMPMTGTLTITMPVTGRLKTPEPNPNPN